MAKLNQFVLTLDEPMGEHEINELVESNEWITIECAEPITAGEQHIILFTPWDPDSVSLDDIEQLAGHFDAIGFGMNYTV